MDTPIVHPLKRCSKCGIEKPATREHFPKHNKTSDGLCSWCKSCHSEQACLWSRVHKDTISAKNKQWRIENPDKAKEKDRKRYAKDPLKERQRFRKYYYTNVEQVRERDRRRTMAKPDKAKIKCHKRLTRLRGLPIELEINDWQHAVSYFHGCCAVCGRQGKDLLGTHTLAADHWIPLSSPDCPGTIPTNIVPLCHGQGGCNNSKNDSDPIEWLNRKFGKRRAKQILERIHGYFASLNNVEG